MAVTVKIPTQLRSVTGGDAETAVDGATTVGDVLDGLYDRYDGLRDRIAVDGDLRLGGQMEDGPRPVGGEDLPQRRQVSLDERAAVAHPLRVEP
jgi:molybdopterin converting factor small subunit